MGETLCVLDYTGIMHIEPCAMYIHNNICMRLIAHFGCSAVLDNKIIVISVG